MYPTDNDWVFASPATSGRSPLWFDCSPSGNSMVGEVGGGEVGYFAILAA